MSADEHLSREETCPSCGSAQIRYEFVAPVPVTVEPNAPAQVVEPLAYGEVGICAACGFRWKPDEPELDDVLHDHESGRGG